MRPCHWLSCLHTFFPLAKAVNFVVFQMAPNYLFSWTEGIQPTSKVSQVLSSCLLANKATHFGATSTATFGSLLCWQSDGHSFSNSLQFSWEPFFKLSQTLSMHCVPAALSFERPFFHRFRELLDLVSHLVTLKSTLAAYMSPSQVPICKYSSGLPAIDFVQKSTFFNRAGFSWWALHKKLLL